MKKKLLLLPLLATLLCGCSINDLMFWKKNSDDSQQKQDDKNNDNDDKEGKPSGDETVHVTSISLSKKSLELEEFTQEKLTFTIFPSNATDKEVEWSTSDSFIASVEDGVVKAWAKGTVVITVTTHDGSKTDICTVSVTESVPEVQTVTKELVFNELSYGENVDPYYGPEEVGDVTFTAANGYGSTNPRYYYSEGQHGTKEYEFRPYAGNTFAFVCSSGNLKQISFTFSTYNPGNLNITSDVGTFESNIWTGSSNSVTFSVENATGGHRRISSFAITYEGETPAPEKPVDLGTKTISEVKQYILDNPVSTNSHGIGVNELRYVTIQGFAIAKIDLEKTTASQGLDKSYRGKVIMADETGSIAVATPVNNQGTSLWGKVGDYVCKPTSKYIVKGYISTYLDQPELMLMTFKWDESLNISWTPSVLSKETVSLTRFYEKAQAINYNCAGHGYGDVVTIENIRCYYVESDGQGTRYYNFTDGSKNLRVNAFNIAQVSDGAICNITGIISMKNLSPIIVAFDITKVSTATDPFDYETPAVSISIENLKAQYHGEQEDTWNRFPDVIGAYGTIFKTTGYLTGVLQDEKFYIGISDNYIAREYVIQGKDYAMANYGISLIKNKNFWNVTLEELYAFNPVFKDYVFKNLEITVYYVVRQQRYQSHKPMWEILLIPQFVSSLKA